MNNTTKQLLTNALLKEFLRRSLTKFFMEKGFDNFLVSPYPQTILNIAEMVPILNGVLEVKYHLDDININTNAVKLKWNIFVLGNNRIYLGDTTHLSLTEISNGLNASDINFSGPRSIKEIIEAIVHFLSKSSKLQSIYDSSWSEDVAPNINLQHKPMPSFKKRV